MVNERRCHVYVLFGKVLGILDEPGFYVLPLHLGLSAFIVKWLGRCYVLDMRLDQKYLRSQPVNSEEGAPMGIGIWYEMFVSDPQSYLFKNVDPVGSLAANVSNSTVRCLSNLPLDKMLANRHVMSQTVRSEVSPKSHEWGYKLGSVYIRKVHFRDDGMIRQIREQGREQASAGHRGHLAGRRQSGEHHQQRSGPTGGCGVRQSLGPSVPRSWGRRWRRSLRTRKWRTASSRSWRHRRSWRPRPE